MWKYEGGLLYFGRDDIMWTYHPAVSLIGQSCNYHFIGPSGDGWTISNCTY